MRTVRLIRAVTEPSTRGPFQGAFALQRALANAKIPWLKIGGDYHEGEIPWVWCWMDIDLAVAAQQLGIPYIIGPNVLFLDSHKPGNTPQERLLVKGNHCLVCFTESPWYAELIRSQCDWQPGLPISIFRYPIHPEVPGPAKVKYDVLIYLKDKRLLPVARWAEDRWPRSIGVEYGRYKRDELIAAARASRCCLYLSTDDRGPLAAAEIALSGCPLVGIERGCPWVANSNLGVRISTFHPEAIERAVGQAFSMSRQRVRHAAEQYFSTGTAVATIRQSIERVRSESTL